MRHKISQRKLNRTSAHRRAMQRNLAQSLFEHGQVRTTLAKAKDLRPFAERLITLAKKTHHGSITARRRIHHLLSDRSLVPEEHREAFEMMSLAGRQRTLRSPSGRRYRTGEAKGRLAFTGESVIHRLVNTLAERYADRDGGYTRLIRLPDRRIGDHSALAVVQLVGDEEGPGVVTKPGKSARRRRADARYAAAVKAGKKSSAPTASDKEAVAAPEPVEPTVSADDPAPADEAPAAASESEDSDET
ncbi:MAG: 50S ribosomal protein L17 [bacterium]|nr:50S ribosomal protein L17 [bacterium]